MGLIPDTGTQITMGGVAASLGLASTNIQLNGTLGVNRSDAITPISNIGTGVETNLSSDFGGLTTPEDYVLEY